MTTLMLVLGITLMVLSLCGLFVLGYWIGFRRGKDVMALEMLQTTVNDSLKRLTSRKD